MRRNQPQGKQMSCLGTIILWIIILIPLSFIITGLNP